jgi:hypothetical protein
MNAKIVNEFNENRSICSVVNQEMSILWVGQMRQIAFGSNSAMVSTDYVNKRIKEE